MLHRKPTGPKRSRKSTFKQSFPSHEPVKLYLVRKHTSRHALYLSNAFDGGPVQPRTIGLDQSVQMTKQLVWDLDQLVQHLDRLFGLLVETVCRV